MAENKCILGNVLIDKLNELGLLPENCQRIIIDLECNDVAKIYYQCAGDTRLLDVDLVNELAVVIREQKEKSTLIDSGVLGDLVGVDSLTVNKWAREGKIPYTFLPGRKRRLFDREKVFEALRKFNNNAKLY